MLGIDKGTAYTKTDKKLCIRSTIRQYKETDINLNNERLLFESDGQQYIIGERGNYSTDLLKAKHLNTKIMILLAVGLSYPNDEYITTDIITGLPIGQYTAQKQEMIDTFKDTKNAVKINNKRQIITIKNIAVFPEGAGAFYSQDKYNDALIIDVGGLSIDTALFERRKLIKYSTYNMGVMKLYSKIANQINSKYDTSFTEWDVENIMQNGLYIYGREVAIDADSLIKEHIKEITERLMLEYDIKTIKNIILSGGAVELLYQYFLHDIPQLKTLDTGQYANAIGYKNIGQVIFNETR